MGILSPLETVEVGCGMMTIVVHISGFGNFSRCTLLYHCKYGCGGFQVACLRIHFKFWHMRTDEKVHSVICSICSLRVCVFMCVCVFVCV